MGFRSEIGLLGYLGYHVGRGGKLKNLRRQILKKAFKIPMWPAIRANVENWEEWGEPCSTCRFRKMINFLFVEMSLAYARENPPYDDAFRDWKADLIWLLTDFAVEANFCDEKFWKNPSTQDRFIAALYFAIKWIQNCLPRQPQAMQLLSSRQTSQGIGTQGTIIT